MKIHPDHLLHIGSMRAGMSILSSPSWYWTCECGKGHVSTEIDVPPDNQYVCSECESCFSVRENSKSLPGIFIVDVGHSYKGLIDNGEGSSNMISSKALSMTPDERAFALLKGREDE